MSTAAARGLGLCALLFLSGCSTQLLRDAAASRDSVTVANAPYFAQRDHQCGPAALATLLAAAGAPASPAALTREVYIPGRRGSVQAEMLSATRRHERIALELQPGLDALLRELEQGRPVLVLQNFGLASVPLWHYAVVVGYERDGDRLLLSSGSGSPQRLAARRFIGTWRRAGYWGFVALRPGELPADDRALPYLEAVAALEALGQHAGALASYQAAVVRWPSEPLAWFALANSRLAAGGKAQAEEAYREVLRLQPDHLPARNNLALLLAQRGCVAQAGAVLEPARAAAGTGPYAAQIADSWREIQALRASAPDCAAH